ncbi:MAG: J domain-containing protein [Balneolia bacterium]|nr:J domain-containing protein [Balneolia bacterium]
MAGKDFYGLLGVSPTESTEEIRKAWIRISRVIHPDRFDPQKQKEDWQQANRMLSEVNEAWQTLKDPKKRELYDIQHGFTSPKSAFTYDDFASASEPDNTPKQPQSHDYGPDPTLELKAGQSPFHKLPDSLQKKLLNRQSGDDEDQYYINTDQSAHHYLKAGFILLWVAILVFSAMGREWSGTITVFLLAGSIFATLQFSKHLLWLIKWHQSPLLSRLYVTPLYIIETHHGFVRWWPVTGIEDIRITSGNAYYPGRNTTLNLKYSGESVRLSITPIQLARNCVGMIQQYRSAIDQALWSYDYGYVHDRNDFRNAETYQPPNNLQKGYFSFGIPALLMAMLFGFLFMENRGNQPQIGNRIISQMLAITAPRLHILRDKPARRWSFMPKGTAISL